MSNPIRRRIPAFAVALTLASVGTACSSSSGTADTTAPSATSDTTKPVATQSSTTGTTEAPTSSTTVEDAIRAAHTRVMTEVFKRDERVAGPEAMLPLAEQLTTDPLLRRIKDAVAQRASSGERAVSPGYESHIIKVTMLDGSTAKVLDCSKDLSEGYGSDGSLTVPADDFYKLRESEVVLVAGHWLVREINSGGDNRCDPAAT